MAKTTQGKCSYCGEIFGKIAMKRHVNGCKSRGPVVPEDKRFCILVQGKYSPEYWMYLCISETSTLAALDDFLRSVWLECCGHLSAFVINGTHFTSDPDSSYREKGMNHKIKNVLDAGMEFTHQYDFGSTTELKLKVVSMEAGAKNQKKIEVMARNLPPHIECSECDDAAVELCCECMWDGTGWLCDKCAKTHECGEEMLLPVVNSPRVGVCGYTGGDDE
ncbi:hypothetical protein EFBL_2705 [Effusibacillus lacus]|uniref:Uncharacterized protein n=2 Tax=Effusibacillus lacus TaxID=1348429 RepID=A0A292YRC8_9BACL|nr:hypothetical protein EFBL_2705 [Effusibacillus lacus]